MALSKKKSSKKKIVNTTPRVRIHPMLTSSNDPTSVIPAKSSGEGAKPSRNKKKAKSKTKVAAKSAERTPGRRSAAKASVSPKKKVANAKKKAVKKKVVLQAGRPRKTGTLPKKVVSTRKRRGVVQSKSKSTPISGSISGEAVAKLYEANVVLEGQIFEVREELRSAREELRVAQSDLSVKSKNEDRLLKMLDVQSASVTRVLEKMQQQAESLRATSALTAKKRA